MRSGEGVVGVLIAWTDIQTSHEVPTADFVVKPVTGGASTLIAERVLSRVAGAAHPDSQTVRRTSDGGRGIIHWIDAMVQDDPSKADKFQGFESAEDFMLHKYDILIHGDIQTIHGS